MFRECIINADGNDYETSTGGPKGAAAITTRQIQRKHREREREREGESDKDSEDEKKGIIMRYENRDGKTRAVQCLPRENCDAALVIIYET